MDPLVLAAHNDGPEGRLLDVGGQRVKSRVCLDGALDGVVHLLLLFGRGGRSVGGTISHARYIHTNTHRSPIGASA